ncbi:hypothetical protein IP91_00325 [Pseudoduganella lurida]|uniref:Uncharacterized protein n=1 Tax=Pseudoduganella lurida TaxID=1036180 RepID=A0A562RJP0_9BURK|nr:hypothetical protein [Pseudoduganella lurida]TWI69258.1 hypothetical protein IP91_00325 [Pseudoduganella lurida]
MFSEIIVGRRDVQMGACARQEPDGKVTVRLSGYIMHSSCTIRSIRVVDAPAARRVLILVGLVRPGEKGGFEIDVPIHSDTQRLYLGTDASAAWERPATGAPPQTRPHAR